MDSEVEKVIFGDKAIENVRCENECWRNRNPDLGEAAAHAMLMEDVADESQAPGFTAQGAAANSQKECLSGLKGGGVKIADKPFALLGAVCSDRGNQIATQIFDGRKIGNLAGAKSLR